MLNLRTCCLMPALCKGCRCVVLYNALQEMASCQRCHGSVTPYSTSSVQSKSRRGGHALFEWNAAGLRFELLDIAYRCPGCGRLKMRFSDMGCWD